jgi:RimJ/RimL family protein N-acetyltransferase
MYGYAMRITSESGLELVLRPYRDGEHVHLLAGMQSYHVLGHTSFRRAFTEAEAAAYLGRLEADQAETGWAVCVVEDGTHPLGRPIGTTSLELHGSDPRRAESGIVIYDRDWWGRGVATLAHTARTHYAFNVMGLIAITSGADQDNPGSGRALLGIGYVKTGVNYHAGIMHGQVAHADRFLLVNPHPGPWSYFWGNSHVPAAFKRARQRTRELLSSAQITYL